MAHYKRNFIKQIIVRIDLVSPLEIEKGLSKKLNSLILKAFPIIEPQQITEGKLQMDVKEIKSAPTNKFTIWNYHGKDREKSLQFGKDYFYIEYHEYKKYDEVKSEFLGLLSRFVEEYPENQIRRFGLRFINKIVLDELNPTDWTNYINSNLLSIFRIAHATEPVSRAFNLLTTNKDDVKFIFQYGIPNPDYPAPIKKKEFILDFDSYYEGELSKSDIEFKIDQFHDLIASYFEEAITDNLRTKMNE